jgi:hypothetical protein
MRLSPHRAEASQGGDNLASEAYYIGRFAVPQIGIVKYKLWTYNDAKIKIEKTRGYLHEYLTMEKRYNG